MKMGERSAINFWEVARRAESGPMMKEDDFDMRISKTAMGLAKEYDIRYDPEILVSSDDSLADDIWRAGIELFIRTGVYNRSNKRVIEFTEWEVKEALKHATKQMEVGKGKDRRRLFGRKVEDKNRAVIASGPFGVEVTLDMFVKLNQAFAQEPLVDILFHGGHIQSVEGVDEIRGGSAFEVQAARLYSEWMLDAITLAGRPFMPMIWYPVSAGLNELGADSVMPRNREDIFKTVALISELKLDDVKLSKVAHFMNYGYNIYAATTPLIGGYGGGPESTAIVAVAEHLAELLVFRADFLHMGPQHIKYRSQTNPASLWMNSVVGQAIARNSDLITTTSVTTAGRPETLQMHYESSALAVCSVVSGRHLTGPRPAQPLYPNHHNPLHSRLFADAAHAATRLKREDANELLKDLVSLYKDRLEFDKAPKGKTFEQSYDVRTLKPTEENMKIHEEAKSKLIDLGLELER